MEDSINLSYGLFRKFDIEFYVYPIVMHLWHVLSNWMKIRLENPF
jgi:hypothetical protein